MLGRGATRAGERTRYGAPTAGRLKNIPPHRQLAYLAVAAQHRGLKVGLHQANGPLDGGEGRHGNCHLARHGVAAADNLEVLGDGAAAVLGEHAGALVAHPAMDTTTPRVDPEQMLERKVLCEVKKGGGGRKGR